MHAREPALVSGEDARVGVHAAGDILHAVELADRFGIGERQRRCRAEAGLEIAEPLPRERVVVLFHRVVFRMEGHADDVSVILERLRHQLGDRQHQRIAGVALMRDRRA